MSNVKALIKKNRTLYNFLKMFLHPYIRYRNKKVYNGVTKLNVLETFPMFVAHGWGMYDIRAKLTIQSINQLLPALEKFSNSNIQNIEFEKSIMKCMSSKESEAQTRLRNLFEYYGSDKSTTHDYHKIYCHILDDINRNGKIFEIGLGTNNTDIVSTMGVDGQPGASLRAFRDYAPNFQIFGADFDTRILFNETNIQTFFVDQTDPKTFDQLGGMIGKDFDLMIDDGLHSPNANLHSLYFFLQNLKVGGYAVVEDINLITKPIWMLVSDLISERFHSCFIETRSAGIFVVKKVE